MAGPHGRLSNQNALDGLFEEFEEVRIEALDQTDSNPAMNAVMMREDTNQKTTTWAWFELFPEMKQWVGERKTTSGEARSFSVETDLYENSIEVDKEDVDDDQLGMYRRQINARTSAYTRKRRSQVFDILENANTASDPYTSYDGAALISDNHSRPFGADQSNKTSNGLTKANIDTAYKDMMQLEDDNGERIGIRPDTLIVGPQLRSTAKDILEKELDNGGETNRLAGSLDLIVTPYLTTNNWFLLDTTIPLKPIIVMDKIRLTSQSITDPDSEYVIMNHAYFYGLEARWGRRAAFWQSIYGGNF